VHYTLLCSPVLYYAILRCTAPHCTQQNCLSGTALYFSSLYYTKLTYTYFYTAIQDYSSLHYTALNYTMLYYAILYYTTLYSTLQYFTLLYSTLLYSTILDYAILHQTTRYYTVLYSAILHCTSRRGESAKRTHLMHIELGPGQGRSQSVHGPSWAGKRPNPNDFGIWGPFEKGPVSSFLGRHQRTRWGGDKPQCHSPSSRPNGRTTGPKLPGPGNLGKN
jgi:hypothetical protein